MDMVDALKSGVRAPPRSTQSVLSTASIRSTPSTRSTPCIRSTLSIISWASPIPANRSPFSPSSFRALLSASESALEAEEP